MSASYSHPPSSSGHTLYSRHAPTHALSRVLLALVVAVGVVVGVTYTVYDFRFAAAVFALDTVSAQQALRAIARVRGSVLLLLAVLLLVSTVWSYTHAPVAERHWRGHDTAEVMFALFLAAWGGLVWAWNGWALV